jgi:YaiO family outer membrane protein
VLTQLILAVALVGVTAADALAQASVAAQVAAELDAGRVASAEELARQALVERPTDTTLLVLHARALDRLGLRKDARLDLNAALRIDPGNDAAHRVRNALRPERPFTFGAGFGSEKLSNNEIPWKETSLALAYHTPVGLLAVRRTRAEPVGIQDDQYEVEAAPVFGATRANVAVGYAPDAVLFPETRVAAEVYQGVGAGVELSIGGSRLDFAGGDVAVYTGSLTKYYANWVFTLRGYATPDSLGRMGAVHGGFRRYYGPDGTSFFGVRYSLGSVREEVRDVSDLEILDSSVVHADMNSSVARWLGISTRFSYGLDELTGDRELKRMSVASGLALRF